jgi:hypothetical protein
MNQFPSLAALGLIGGALASAKVNTVANLEWARLINLSCSGNAKICVRLTLDSSLKLVKEQNFGNGLLLKIYADVSGPKLNVYIHGEINLDLPVLVNMNVNLKPEEGFGMITLQVFPANNPIYRYHGHMWFGDIQLVFGAISNGNAEIHSVSVYSVPNMQARYQAGLISAYTHFLEGFTFVFASSEVSSLPGNFAFFRFRKGFLETQTVSITALGMEVADGDFYKFSGDFKSSTLVTDKTDHIALLHAFREGVGSFNLKHLIKTSSTEKIPEKFAKACWNRILKMADEGLFTFVDTQKGEFAVPTLKLLLSL